MSLCRVAGTVVASTVAFAGVWRVVVPCTAEGLEAGGALVALDAVGSREGDVVLVATGSSCRWTEQTDGAPIDALVVGIVDAVERRGGLAYGGARGA